MKIHVANFCILGAFVREQMNQKSAFMDLSQVYGSTEFELSQLRDDDGMHLKSRRGMLGGPHGNQGTGDLLAFTQVILHNFCIAFTFFKSLFKRGLFYSFKISRVTGHV